MKDYLLPRVCHLCPLLTGAFHQEIFLCMWRIRRITVRFLLILRARRIWRVTMPSYRLHVTDNSSGCLYLFLNVNRQNKIGSFPVRTPEHTLYLIPVLTGTVGDNCTDNNACTKTNQECATGSDSKCQCRTKTEFVGGECQGKKNSV